MDIIRARSRVVSLCVFILFGNLFLVASIIEPHYKSGLHIGILCSWVVMVIILFFTIPRKYNVKIYTTIHLISLNCFTSFVQVYFEEDYLIYLIFMIQWMMSLMLVTPKLLNATAEVQILTFAALTFIPYFSQYTGYDLRDLVIVILVEYFAKWIGTTLIMVMLQTDRERYEQERGMDEMLQLVYSKHREARAATQSKSNFLSNMSHEIRTPINAVIGMNEMIIRESKDDNISDYAESIRNSGNMLLSLVNNILDFSKIESGKMELVTDEYELREIIIDLNNMISKRMEDKGLNFTIEVDKNLPSKYYGDEIRIKQIILNLLTNAVKYTEEGYVKFKVSGKSDGDTMKLLFSVEDSGVGIKAEDMNKLKSQFVRLDERRNKKVEGTGLGITIVNSLLNIMGSNLEVESEYEKGSRFFFELSQRIVDDTPIGELDNKNVHHTKKKKHKTSFTAPMASILVVDDNTTNLKVFQLLLKETKCKIDAVDSGKKAIEKAKEKKYHIIFMDHMMPEMDGIETLKNIRNLSENVNADTPVYAFTANAIAGAKEMYLANGFEGFLTKPIDPDKLEMTIRNSIPEELLIDNEEADEGEDVNGNVDDEAVEDFDADSLPQIEGLDWNVGYMHTNDVSMLLDIVKKFPVLIQTEVPELSSLYEKSINGDKEALDLFRIKVHSLKSTANLIGLIPIAGTAAVLEYASRDENINHVKNVTPFFLEECEKYKTLILNELCKEEVSCEKQPWDSKEIKFLLNDLCDYMELFDVDGADEILKEIKKYEIKDDLKERFLELESKVLDLDVENVKNLVEIIKKTD